MAHIQDNVDLAMEFALMDEHETLLLSDPKKTRKGLSKGWMDDSAFAAFSPPSRAADGALTVESNQSHGKNAD